MIRRRRLPLVLISALALVAASALTALALINPNFTPNDLVEQSDTILVVTLSKPDAANRMKLGVVRAIKGKVPEGDVFIDLAAASQKAWAEHVGKLAAARGQDPVPLFIGKYTEQGEGEMAEPMEGALLQIDRDWVVLYGSKPGVWSMSHVEAKKQGTWDGGSDMLIKCVEYLQKNPDDRVPVEIGCDWLEAKKPGKVGGKVSAARVVDVEGKGSFTLHVASGGGDRLFAFRGDSKELTDVTDQHKLEAKSAASAWGDFNGDGRLDLASWDGSGLSLRVGAEGGSLATKVDVAVELDGGCLALAAVDAGVKGKAGLLASTPKGPVLLVPEGATFKAKPLAAGSDDLGAVSACLAADLDGDAIYDVLMPGEKGGLVWRGKLGGEFEAPVKVAVATGKGRCALCVGDYDMDGLLEVYMIGPDCCRLWSNKGGFKFSDAFGHSGEMCYTAQPGGVCAETGDLNNDGLQDIFVAYASDTVHHYFNRGFRSFGKSLSTIWENQEVQGDAIGGQQAGTYADLNGDGAEDMILVLKDGNVVVYLREVWEDEPPLNLRVVLPVGADCAGPVTVTGWNDRRCLGTWSVSPGTRGAVFGLASPGEVKIKWKFPGGAEQEKVIELEKKREIFALTPGAAAPAEKTPEPAPGPASGTDDGGKPAKVAPAAQPGLPPDSPQAQAKSAMVVAAVAAAVVLLIVIIVLVARKGKS